MADESTKSAFAHAEQFRSKVKGSATTLSATTCLPSEDSLARLEVVGQVMGNLWKMSIIINFEGKPFTLCMSDVDRWVSELVKGYAPCVAGGSEVKYSTVQFSSVQPAGNGRFGLSCAKVVGHSKGQRESGGHTLSELCNHLDSSE